MIVARVIAHVMAALALMQSDLRRDAVSFSRDVAPVLALRCHICHGDESTAGGLDTRSYASLREALVPGDPENSQIVQFIEGRRGTEHRMPLGGPALAPEQIQTIGRWIAEGAHEDRDTAPVWTLSVADVPTRRGNPVRITASSPVDAYLVLRIVDRSGRQLYRAAAAGNFIARPRPDVRLNGRSGRSAFGRAAFALNFRFVTRRACRPAPS